MPKPDFTTIPVFYHKYVQLVQEDDVIEALKANMASTLAALQNVPPEKWSHRYADGKWTIREMVQHIIDAERIFSYRALCIARGEQQSLPGFDENRYAAASDAEKRTDDKLMEEFEAVRRSTSLLFASFSNEQLYQMGIANGKPIGVNSIGFITVGHVIHHLNILKERYLQ